MASAGWHGLVAVDKPAGPTSHDVVARVRRALASPGAGHVGTLDPMATGLLVVALGAATRAIRVWQGGAKTYEATLRFGVVTDSQDREGRVLETHDTRGLDETTLRNAATRLLGVTRQTPPMVSALKVGGERLHALARRGLEVERTPRSITVHAWEWLEFALPLARARITCSSGTYVRTLAHDLGRDVGCGATLEALRRTRSEPFGVEQALPLATLESLPMAETLERAGIPLDRALAGLPAVVLGTEAAETLGRGGRPSFATTPPATPEPPLSVVFRDVAGRALALGTRIPDPERAGHSLAAASVVFPWATRSGRTRDRVVNGGAE